MTIDWVLPAVDLEDRDRPVTIDFISRRMFRRTFEFVSPRHVIGAHVLEAEFAHMELFQAGIRFRVGRVIPCVHLHTNQDVLMTPGCHKAKRG